MEKNSEELMLVATVFQKMIDDMYKVEWYHISAVKNRTRSDKIKKGGNYALRQQLQT